MLRLLRGEDLESVSRELGVTAARASQWGVVARIVTGPPDAHRQNPHLPMRDDTGRPSSIEVTATILDNVQ